MTDPKPADLTLCVSGNMCWDVYLHEASVIYYWKRIILAEFKRRLPVAMIPQIIVNDNNENIDEYYTIFFVGLPNQRNFGHMESSNNEKARQNASKRNRNFCWNDVAVVFLHYLARAVC